MLVCAHGEVSEYCDNHDMTICETWSGKIEEYRGSCWILVTDQEMTEQEYYFMKGRLLARGVELVSIRHKDDKQMAEFLAYQANRRRQCRNVRQAFGFALRNGEVVEIPEMMEVARKVIALRDRGIKLRDIKADPEVRHADGREISLSTIQLIIRNREKYEK